MKKRGMTLIELLVSMSIFSIVLLVAVGAFINMNNLRAVALSMRESQQKLRMGIEMISRYSRQAEKVIIGGTCDANRKCNELEMYFNLEETTPYGVKFQIDQTSHKLFIYECPSNRMSTTSYTCASNGWGVGNDMLGGEMVVNTSSGFTKNYQIAPSGETARIVAAPASLNVLLSGSLTRGNQYYTRDFNVDTRVILENVK